MCTKTKDSLRSQINKVSKANPPDVAPSRLEQRNALAYIHTIYPKNVPDKTQYLKRNIKRTEVCRLHIPEHYAQYIPLVPSWRC